MVSPSVVKIFSRVSVCAEPRCFTFKYSRQYFCISLRIAVTVLSVSVTYTVIGEALVLFVSHGHAAQIHASLMVPSQSRTFLGLRALRSVASSIRRLLSVAPSSCASGCVSRSYFQYMCWHRYGDAGGC